MTKFMINEDGATFYPNGNTSLSAMLDAYRWSRRRYDCATLMRPYTR